MGTLEDVEAPDPEMPQLLSMVRPNAKDVSFSALEGPAFRSDDMAKFAMQAIADFSILDTFMSGVMVELLGSNPVPGAAIYGALTGTSTQKVALRAVARTHFPYASHHDDIFEAILELYGKAATARARIAHWIWGATPDLPDRVLMVHPETVLKYHVRFAQFEAKQPPSFLESLLIKTNAPPEPEPGIPFDAIYVFGADDFRKLSKEIHQISGYLVGFRNLMAVPRQIQKYGVPGAETAQTVARLNSLLREPAIRAIVDRRVKHRKKTPSTPPSPLPSEEPPTPPASTE